MSARETNYGAWIEKAEHDLLNIENNLVAERVPWDTVCVHAQQAGEKLLKAFVVYHGNMPARTHDIVALLESCVKIDPALAALEQDCQTLGQYAADPRYPSESYEPEEQDARDIVEAARKVRSAVLARLPRPDG